jgi:O-antigen/teichoic acid export membrane protein
MMLYAVLMLAGTGLLTLVWIVYCRASFAECRLSFVGDKSLYRKIAGYSGWNFLGSLTSVAQGQGLNILLNLFFGTKVNAAWGLSVQVKNAVNQLGGNFMTAVRPQVIKLYAQGAMREMLNLVYSSAKYGFALMLLVTVPLFLEIDFVLQLWLGEVPAHTANFCRIAFGIVQIGVMRAPFIHAFHAVGHMKLGNMLNGGLLIAVLPLSWLALRLNAPPEAVLWISFGMCIVVQWSEVMVVLRRYLPISLGEYLRKGWLTILALLAVGLPLPCWIHFHTQEGFSRFALILFSNLLMVAMGAYLVASKQTRTKLKQKLFKRGSL